MSLPDLILGIKPLDESARAAAWLRLNSLTKPPGSLGRLEDIAARHAAIRGAVAAAPENPAIITFAADHGVAAAGVSAYPREVTRQMVANFAAGGAAINVLARRAGARLLVVDVGVAGGAFDPPPSSVNGGRGVPVLIQRKLAEGTANLAEGPAMSEELAERAILLGAEIAAGLAGEGCDLLGLGEMGIGNTTPSAALYCAFLGASPAEIVGRGTGIDEAALERKTACVAQALEVNQISPGTPPLAVLARVGGLEIAAICGAILAGAAARIPLVVDGFISGAAALAASRLNPLALDYCFFSHRSAEAGHAAALRQMGATPLIDLNLRLGEGTGAALAFDIIAAAVDLMNNMATFESAGVSGKEPAR